MNLYRLDYLSAGPTVPVYDAFGPVLMRDARRADARAIAEAAAADCAVRISRISGCGSMRAMRIANPDGTVHRIPAVRRGAAC